MFSMLWNAFLQQPFWVQTVLIIAIFLRLGWPDFFAQRIAAPNRRRWRQRRSRWDD